MLLGKEIDLFFGQYGTIGILGIIISCFVMGIITYFVLNLAKNKKIEQYKELSQYLNTNKQIGEIIKIIMNLFLLISFYIMIAGFGAYFSQQLGISSFIRKRNHCYIMLFYFFREHG